jgi:hypothetical protein
VANNESGTKTGTGTRAVFQFSSGTVVESLFCMEPRIKSSFFSGINNESGTWTGTGTRAFFEFGSGTGVGNLFSVKVNARVFNYSADFFVARFQRAKFTS